MDEKKFLIVLGMHRSGTSSIAGMLSSFTADFGKKTLAPDEYNKSGYFENESIVSINKKIMSNSGLDWYSLIINNNISIDNQTKKEAEQIINKEFTKSLCVIKDPRISRTAIHEFWDKILNSCQINRENRVYVIANRHPECVAQSLKKRNNFPRILSLYLWLFHQYEALSTVINKQYKSIIINYDDLFLENSQKKIIENLSSLLGRYPSDRIKINPNLRNFTLSSSCEHNEFHTFYQSIRGITNPNLELEQTLKTLNVIEQFLDSENLHIKSLDEMTKLVLFLSDSFSQKLKQKQREIAKLKSKLEWLQNRKVYRLYKFLKKIHLAV